jgi:hypothetical protein
MNNPVATIQAKNEQYFLWLVRNESYCIRRVGWRVYNKLRLFVTNKAQLKSSAQSISLSGSDMHRVQILRQMGNVVPFAQDSFSNTSNVEQLVNGGFILDCHFTLLLFDCVHIITEIYLFVKSAKAI